MEATPPFTQIGKKLVHLQAQEARLGHGHEVAAHAVDDDDARPVVLHRLTDEVGKFIGCQLRGVVLMDAKPS